MFPAAIISDKYIIYFIYKYKKAQKTELNCDNNQLYDDKIKPKKKKINPNKNEFIISSFNETIFHWFMAFSKDQRGWEEGEDGPFNRQSFLVTNTTTYQNTRCPKILLTHHPLKLWLVWTWGAIVKMTIAIRRTYYALPCSVTTQ